MDNVEMFYKQRISLKNTQFSRIAHNDAMVAVVYKITTPTHSPLILKISPRKEDYFREYYFLNYFAGILPVPRIIQAIPPEEENHGAILMEYLPGALLHAADITERLAYDIGSLLAGIHSHRTVDYGDLSRPHNLNQGSLYHFALKFEEGLRECRHHLPEVLLEKCHRYFDDHTHLFTSVDGPCIIHRDFRPSNLIVNNGKLQGIIDWASGRASFAEEDFCPLKLGEWRLHPRSKKSFLAGYASIRPIPNYHSLMPLLQLNRVLATIGFTIKHNLWRTSHTGLYNANYHFIETFFQKEINNEG